MVRFLFQLVVSGLSCFKIFNFKVKCDCDYYTQVDVYELHFYLKQEQNSDQQLPASQFEIVFSSVPNQCGYITAQKELNQ